MKQIPVALTSWMVGWSAYHQLITNEFRNERAYGMKPPEANEQLRIMKAVYSKYPLPGVHF